MMQELEQALGTVEVQAPSDHEALRVFGLRWAELRPGPPYITLDEALQSKDLDVSEVSQSGSVPEIQVVNRGDTMVFIMSGEELVGAKQNRVLNVSIMVKPHSEQPIPVSCVEAGRWSYRSQRFSSSGSTSHSLLRQMMSKQAHEGYRISGIPTSKQGAVWAEVARKLGRMGSHSPSSQLRQAFEDRQDKLDETLEELQPPRQCSGVVFAMGNRIVGLDLFDKPETLVKLWPKILRGYAIDAIEGPDEPSSVLQQEIRDWLRSLATARTEEYESPGTGQDVRLESGALHGAALLVDRHPIHVEAFAEKPA